MLTEIELQALWLSLRVGFWSTVVALPLALLAAWVLSRRRFSGRRLLDVVVHVPLVLPPVVVGYLLLILLGRQGPLGGLLHQWFEVTVVFTWQGAAIASAIMAFPLAVRAIRLSLDAVDRRLETAARTLGASPVRVFVTITLPLTAPGILAGAVLGFARSVGEFGATITFVSNIAGETRTLPLALFTAVQTPGTEPAAARLVIISVAIALVALLASELLAQRFARHLEGRP